MNVGSLLKSICTKYGFLSKISSFCEPPFGGTGLISAHHLDSHRLFSTYTEPNKNSHQKRQALQLTGALFTGANSRFGKNHYYCTRNSFFTNFSSHLHSNSCQPKAMWQSKRDELLAEKYQPKECKFPTSYGYIAGLEWGNPNAQNKILCVHGWLDNSGSFEPLIPYILDHQDNHEKYHIVAIDMPGVGHSSHLPSGATYSQLIVVAEMRRVTQQLKWDTFNLIGHSMGAHSSFLYSCLYPTQVLSMISIDLVSPMTRPVRNSHITLASSIEDHLKYEYEHEDDPTVNINSTVYSETDALKRLMEAHSNALTRDSALILMKRGAKRFGAGYIFTRDLRWRSACPEMYLDDDAMLKFMSVPFRTKTMLIVADSSYYKKPRDIFQKYLDLYRANCPIMEHITLKGTHHLHMNTPEPVAIEINRFLKLVQSCHDTLTKSNL